MLKNVGNFAILLTAATMMLPAVGVSAEGIVREYSGGNFELSYNDVTGEFTGTKAASFSKDGLPLESQPGIDVVIPDEINGTELKSIPRHGFFDCDRIISIKFPKGITSIGERSFVGCDRLESVTIPDSVTELGEDIFESCDVLESATLGKGVSTVPAKCFFSCKSLKTVELPEGITSIGSSAFAACKSLETIVLPDTVKELSDGCFKDCTALTEIVIPDSITKIPSNAFSGCKSLRNVVLPENLGSIDKNAFKDCISLKVLRIGEKCRTLDTTCFSGCKNLKIACVNGSKTQLFALANGIETMDYDDETNIYNSENTLSSSDNVQQDEHDYKYTDGSAGISLVVNGKSVDCGDAEPVIQNGSTLVPMRPLLTAIGCKNITWDTETKTLKCAVDGTTVQMTINNDVATVNGANVKMAVAPQIINSSTYVPARFVSENFGLSVSWDAETKTVVVK